MTIPIAEAAAPAHTLRTVGWLLAAYLLGWAVAFLIRRTPRAELAARFLLTTGSLALTIGALELLALVGLVDYRLVLGTPISEPWRHPRNRLDPGLLHIHEPYYRGRFEGIDYRYDRHGLRNDVDYDSADAVLIGDSFVEGWKVPADDLVSRLLAERLHRSVANLGQSWYGPQQELELLRRFGVPLRPRVCVWTFFEANDLDDLRRYHRATRNWNEFSRSLRPFKDRSFTRNAVLAARRVVALWRLSQSEPDPDPEGFPSGVFTEADGRRTTVYFLDDSPPLSAADDSALAEVGDIFRRARDLCAGGGGRLLVVFIPTKFRVYGTHVQADRSASPFDKRVNDFPARIAALVRDAAPDAGFLDLTPALEEAAGRGVMTYFPGYDTHWSREGHRVAAEAIVGVLERWQEREGWALRAR
jgi:hypothetical protein